MIRRNPFNHHGLVARTGNPPERVGFSLCTYRRAATLFISPKKASAYFWDASPRFGNLASNFWSARTCDATKWTVGRFALIDATAPSTPMPWLTKYAAKSVGARPCPFLQWTYVFILLRFIKSKNATPISSAAGSGRRPVLRREPQKIIHAVRLGRAVFFDTDIGADAFREKFFRKTVLAAHIRADKNVTRDLRVIETLMARRVVINILRTVRPHVLDYIIQDSEIIKIGNSHRVNFPVHPILYN